MSLFCASYLPDQVLKECRFVSVLTKVAANLTRCRGLTTTGPDLDLCFLLPGESDEPDFRGMRFHSYQTDQTILRIEAAVPAALLESDLSESYIIAALRDAIDNAAEFFSEIKVAFDSSAYHSQIQAAADVN